METQSTSGAELAQNAGADGRDGLHGLDGRVVISSASVRVMRSVDYCHFEVSLSAQARGEGSSEMGDRGAALTLRVVDELRKAAARLADKAVAQFQKAREMAERCASMAWLRKAFLDEAARIEEKVPEGERTPPQKAIVKCARDEAYWAGRGGYDYEDEARPEEAQADEAYDLEGLKKTFDIPY